MCFVVFSCTWLRVDHTSLKRRIRYENPKVPKIQVFRILYRAEVGKVPECHLDCYFSGKSGNDKFKTLNLHTGKIY